MACLSLVASSLNAIRAEPRQDRSELSPDVERLEVIAQPWLHDWLWLPEWIRLSFNYTNEIDANPSGGNEQTGTYTHNVAINSAFSSGFGKEASEWQEIDHWTLKITASQSRFSRGQYIFNPMGKGDADDPLVLSLQMSFSF